MRGVARTLKVLGAALCLALVVGASCGEVDELLRPAKVYLHNYTRDNIRLYHADGPHIPFRGVYEVVLCLSDCIGLTESVPVLRRGVQLSVLRFEIFDDPRDVDDMGKRHLVAHFFLEEPGAPGQFVVSQASFDPTRAWARASVVAE